MSLFQNWNMADTVQTTPNYSISENNILGVTRLLKLFKVTVSCVLEFKRIRRSLSQLCCHLAHFPGTEEAEKGCLFHMTRAPG